MCDFGFSRAIAATFRTELLLHKDQHKKANQRNLCWDKESSNFPTEAADMNGDLSINNRLSQDKDLVAEFRSLLHDIPDLPPDHELLRWIHATSVKWVDVISIIYFL